MKVNDKGKKPPTVNIGGRSFTPEEVAAKAQEIDDVYNEVLGDAMKTRQMLTVRFGQAIHGHDAAFKDITEMQREQFGESRPKKSQPPSPRPLSIAIRVVVNNGKGPRATTLRLSDSQIHFLRALQNGSLQKELVMGEFNLPAREYKRLVTAGLVQETRTGVELSAGGREVMKGV